MFDDAFCCHKIKINNFNKEFLACVNFSLLNTQNKIYLYSNNNASKLCLAKSVLIIL